MNAEGFRCRGGGADVEGDDFGGVGFSAQGEVVISCDARLLSHGERWLEWDRIRRCTL